MKKEYIKPTANIMELDCAGMLCTSDTPTAPETPNFDTSDPETLPVGKDPWSGNGTVL